MKDLKKMTIVIVIYFKYKSFENNIKIKIVFNIEKKKILLLF